MVEMQKCREAYTFACPFGQFHFWPRYLDVCAHNINDYTPYAVWALWFGRARLPTLSIHSFVRTNHMPNDSSSTMFRFPENRKTHISNCAIEIPIFWFAVPFIDMHCILVELLWIDNYYKFLLCMMIWRAFICWRKNIKEQSKWNETEQQSEMERKAREKKDWWARKFKLNKFEWIKKRHKSKTHFQIYCQFSGSIDCSQKTQHVKLTRERALKHVRQNFQMVCVIKSNEKKKCALHLILVHGEHGWTFIWCVFATHCAFQRAFCLVSK